MIEDERRGRRLSPFLAALLGASYEQARGQQTASESYSVEPYLLHLCGFIMYSVRHILDALHALFIPCSGYLRPR